MPKTPRVKHRAKVEITDSKYKYSQPYHKGDQQEFTTDYGNRSVIVWLDVPKKIGEVRKYTVTVEYLGEKQYKQTYQQRVKALASSEKRREKYEKEREQQELQRQEKELIQRRNRIANQVELAFVKKVQGAVDFITCDECDDKAAYLGLAYENPASQVIDSEQITGAWCEKHHGNTYNGRFYPNYRPFKTKAAIACERLEFFYDGLRQLCVKAA